MTKNIKPKFLINIPLGDLLEGKSEKKIAHVVSNIFKRTIFQITESMGLRGTA